MRRHSVNLLQIRKATQDQLELPATDICGAVSLRMRQTSELHLPLLSMPYSGRRCGICKEHSTTDKAVSQNLVCGIMYKNYVTYMYLYIYIYVYIYILYIYIYIVCVFFVYIILYMAAKSEL